MDYWNTYSDLYSGCKETEIQKIEAATKARKLGRVILARKELADLNSSWKDLPVLLLEKVNLEASCGLHGDGAKLLADALDADIQSATTTSKNLLSLLSLNHAETTLRVRGSLKLTLEVARKQKAHLESIPLDSWDSIIIGCAVSYYSIIVQAHSLSGWVNIEEDLHLRGVHDDLSIEKLREHLISGEYLTQAFLLLKYELHFIDQEHAITRSRMFLEQCQKVLSSSQPAVVFLITVRFFLADLLFDAVELDLSQQELEDIADLLGKHSCILDTDLPYRMLRHYQAQLSVARSFRNIPALFTVASKSREEGDYLHEYLALACIKLGLNKVDRMERDEEWYLYLAQYQKLCLHRQSTMDENVLAAEVCTNLTVFFQFIGVPDYKAATEFLVSIKSFENRYPDFDVPLYRRILYTEAEQTATSFGHPSQAEEFEIKRDSAQVADRVREDDKYSRYRSGDASNWSEGLFSVILSWIKLSMRSGELSLTEARDLLNVQNVEAEQDSCTDDAIVQFSKYVPETLGKEFFNHLNPDNSDVWEKKFLKYRDWLWNRPSCIQQRQRHTVIADLLRVRASVVQSCLQTVLSAASRQLKGPDSTIELQDLDFELRQIRIKDMSFSLEMRRSLDRGAQDASELALFTAEWILRNSQACLAAFPKAHQLGLITDGMLREHQDWFEDAYERCALTFVTQRLLTLGIIAMILKFRYLLFGSVTLDEILHVLERLESDYIQERQTKSVLAGHEDILARSRIWEQRNFANHYDQAIGFCFEALGLGRLPTSFHKRTQPNTDSDSKRLSSLLSRDAMFAEAVKWAQKKKARSVTEVLGAEIVIPQKLMVILDEHPDAQKLLHKEEKLQASIVAGVDNPDSIQRDLQDLRQIMRNHEGLSQIMSMRNGEAITYQEILSLSKSLGPHVVITDFLHLETSHTGRNGEIWFMIFHDGSLIDTDLVDESLDTAGLQRWSDTFTDTDNLTPFSEAEGSDNLNLLFPLISSTVKHSKPGDTILFSVTAGLTSIPLHAIEVNGEPLIARNKVIYTQSLSVFRLCQFSARTSSTEPVNMIAVQALKDSELARSDSPSMQFASRLDATLLKGPELNKESFLQAITNSSLIHFYGHVEFKRKEPLESCLKIRDRASEDVTVRDLFDTRLRSGAHVSLVACQSGEAWKGTNDDSLGLTTALFHGGAASVLSAQWVIKKKDGNEFQEAFYSELLKQSGQDLHDLADALQKAVLQLRIGPDGKVRAPYHWAGFILQGCWDRFPTLSGKLGK